MKIRKVRSKEIEFDVDPQYVPRLGAEVKLTIAMGDATVERTYRVTQIQKRNISARPPRESLHVVVVTAEGDGDDA